MFCNSCGAQLEENTAFCTQCGAPVKAEEAPVADAPAYEAAPAYDAPAYEAAPAYDAPAYEAAPASDAPAYEAAPAYVAPEAANAPAGEVSPKSRTVALILACVVGALGINRLYLGTKGGVSRLVMYIIGAICSACCSYLPILAIVALPLLIICMVGEIKDIIRSAKGTMVDGNGLPVKKW